MRQIIKCIVIFLFLSQVLCQDQSYCNVTNTNNQITLDQGTAVVCLHVMLNGTYDKTYAFKLNVDYFQSLVINGFANYIKTKINANITSVSVEVQFQNSNNDQNKTIEIYNKTAPSRYRDILSFVIVVEQGKFYEIAVDNQKCDNLGSGAVCYENQGYTSSDGTYGGNDPRFFVSWMGSDINKNHFISHTRRLSRYASFSVGSIWNDAKNVINA